MPAARHSDFAVSVLAALRSMRRERGFARPSQVLVESQSRRFVSEARAINLDVGQNLADVAARLLDGDALDPVDRVDARLARIAELADPLVRAAWPGIVARDAEHVGAVELGEAVGNVGGRDHGVIGAVDEKLLVVALDLVVVADVVRRALHDLQDAARPRSRDGIGVEFGLLPGKAQ